MVHAAAHVEKNMGLVEVTSCCKDKGKKLASDGALLWYVTCEFTNPK